MTWTRDEYYSEKDFEYYYEQARQELLDEGDYSWGGAPTKQQIRDRAAKLALETDDVDYGSYQSLMADAKQDIVQGPWTSPPSESELLQSARSHLLLTKNEANSATLKPSTDAKKEEQAYLLNVYAAMFKQPDKRESKEELLNIIEIEKIIKQFQNQYKNRFYVSDKFKDIGTAWQRAKQSFEKNNKIDLQTLLTTRFDKKYSLKEAFEIRQLFGKQDVYQNLCRALQAISIRRVEASPPGGVVVCS